MKIKSTVRIIMEHPIMYHDATPISALFSMEKPGGNYMPPEEAHVRSTQFPPQKKEKFEETDSSDQQDLIIRMLIDALIVSIVFLILNSTTAERILAENFSSLMEYSLLVRAMCAGALFVIAKIIFKQQLGD